MLEPLLKLLVFTKTKTMVVMEMDKCGLEDLATLTRQRLLTDSLLMIWKTVKFTGLTGLV